MEKQTLFESRVKRAEELFIAHDLGPDIEVLSRGREWCRFSGSSEWCLEFPFSCVVLEFSFSRVGDDNINHGEFRVRFALDTDVPLSSGAVNAKTGVGLGVTQTSSGLARPPGAR